ncbi:response regulator [Pseudobacillus sp. FSL P4-0506]|uniref:response regulator n=1 Tax=unclassified Pseudobacillus TaxID=2619284 RepID=UPI0030F4D31E
MIRAILADDEPLALELMKKRLAHFQVEVVGTYPDAPSLLKDINNISFNAAFLDIDLPGISGLDLAVLIQDEKPNVQIVFTTAHRDYAIQAFELDSIDYLLKPILKERLAKTIDRLEDKLNLEKEKEPILSPQSPSLYIQCFKQFSIVCNNTAVKWKTAKIKEVFAFLTLHLDKPVHRDILIDQLWPGHDYQKAKIHLHTCISYVRKQLEGFGPGNTLTFAGQQYTLHLHDAVLDVSSFEKLSESISSNNVEDVEKVLLLYTGAFMEEEAYEWARPKADELSAKLIAILHRLADYYEQNSLEDKYIGCLHKILQFNPYSEHIVTRLMLGYAHLGMRADAIRLYENFEKKLKEEIGIHPGKETVETLMHIQQGQT